MPSGRSKETPSDPFSSPQDQLTHRVMVGLMKIGIALKSQAWHDIGPRGLTPTQGQILTLLQNREGLRLSDLASELAVTPATASDAVAALIQKGLVRKSRDPEDGRAVRIHLTARGRQEARRISGWPDFLAEAVEAMTPEEQRGFWLGLVKMIRTLQERGQIPVVRMCITCRHFRPNVHPDPERPHHCSLVDNPLGDHQIRLDCPHHEPLGPGQGNE